MIYLDSSFEHVLTSLEKFGEENDRNESDRNRKMLNLERPTAELLYLLVVSSARTRILEIGTSNGYSALWLAAALRANGGDKLLTIETSAEKVVQARENLRAAGVDDHVDILEGDATAVCSQLEGSFDCVFFDADRVSAPQQLKVLFPKLSPNALLLADNALSHPDEIASYLAAVEATDQFDTTIVPVGKGLHVAQRRVRR